MLKCIIRLSYARKRGAQVSKIIKVTVTAYCYEGNGVKILCNLDLVEERH